MTTPAAPRLAWHPGTGMAARYADGAWWTVDYATAKPVHPADAAELTEYPPPAGHQLGDAERTLAAVREVLADYPHLDYLDSVVRIREVLAGNPDPLSLCRCGHEVRQHTLHGVRCNPGEPCGCTEVRQ